MAAKGAAKSCCCTGCEGRPYDSSIAFLSPDAGPGDPNRISFAGHAVDLIQAFCCSCAPDAVCVLIHHYESGASATTKMRLECSIDANPDDGYLLLYSGSVALHGHVIDLRFSFRVVNNRCYFCVSSTYLDISEQCVVIEPKHRYSPYLFCKTLSTAAVYGLFPEESAGHTAFEVSGGYIGDISIRISAESMSPIHGRPPCIEPDGTIRPDTDPINNICKGCGCVCDNACLFVYYTKTGTVTDGLVSRNGTVWSGASGAYGPEVEILAGAQADGYPCLLRLKSLGIGSTVTGPFPSATISVANKQCPMTDVRWQFVDPDGHTVIAHFVCANCLGCKIMTGLGCCYGYDFPRILHVTIWTTGSANIQCNCLPITLPMLFIGSPITASWRAELDIDPTTPGGSWCFGTTKQNFYITLTCTGAGWQLNYQASSSGGGASPCAGGLTSPQTTCEPLKLSFETNGSCCGPTFPTNPITLHFEVTE